MTITCDRGDMRFKPKHCTSRNGPCHVRLLLHLSARKNQRAGQSFLTLAPGVTRLCGYDRLKGNVGA
jgi:hypothetical protein